MAAFIDFCRKHKHHEWRVFVTSVTDEFGDTLIKSFVLGLLDPTLANFHSSKCTSLRLFNWLVIELSVAKIDNGTSKPTLQPNQECCCLLWSHNILQTSLHLISRGNGVNTMRRSATHILRGMGTRTDDPGHMIYLKTHLFTPEKLYFTKTKIKIKNWGRGQFSGRAGTLNKYIFYLAQWITAKNNRWIMIVAFQIVPLWPWNEL